MNSKSIIVTIIIIVSITIWAGLAVKEYGEKQIQATKDRQRQINDIN